MKAEYPNLHIFGAFCIVVTFLAIGTFFSAYVVVNLPPPTLKPKTTLEFCMQFDLVRGVTHLEPQTVCIQTRPLDALFMQNIPRTVYTQTPHDYFREQP